MAIIRLSEADKKLQSDAIAELHEYYGALSAKFGRSMTYELLTYGCQLNEADSEKLGGMLMAIGLEPKQG